jgi:hypothetical protein
LINTVTKSKEFRVKIWSSQHSKLDSVFWGGFWHEVGEEFFFQHQVGTEMVFYISWDRDGIALEREHRKKEHKKILQYLVPWSIQNRRS